jgi:hypothetical protein
VWFVQFVGGEVERQTIGRLRSLGLNVARNTINDYAGRPFISVVRPTVPRGEMAIRADSQP